MAGERERGRSQSEEGRRSGTRAANWRLTTGGAPPTNKCTAFLRFSPAAAKLFYSPCCPLLLRRRSFPSLLLQQHSAESLLPCSCRPPWFPSLSRSRQPARVRPSIMAAKSQLPTVNTPVSAEPSKAAMHPAFYIAYDSYVCGSCLWMFINRSLVPGLLSVPV